MEELLEQIREAVVSLERSAAILGERQVALAAEAEQSVGRIVATVEGQREAELAERLRVTEERLLAAEARVAELSAAATSGDAGAAGGRKTLSAGVVATLAKGGVAVGALEGGSGRMEAASLDAALASLSIEQRFAVKAELLRAGVL